MANTLLSVFRNVLFSSAVNRANNAAVTAIFNQRLRFLYSKTTLGVDEFVHTRERIKSQMSSVTEKFKEKMSEYVAEDSNNMIFTEDLKNMIHLSEGDTDVDLVVKMMKKYNKQNKSMRFGNFVFGPVIMRMFYVNKKADLALECFKSPELQGFFDQFMSYQILLDMLYETQQYKEVLEVVNMIKEKQLEGARYPKNVVVLAFAACYKMNNKESLDYALNLWTELQETGHLPMRRATTFCAALALNQGKPEVALEILSATKNPMYTTVRNLKVAALAEINRIEDVIPILKSVLREDAVQGQIQTFNRDVLDQVKKAVEKSDNGEVIAEFNRLLQLFQKQGHISEMSLADQLCMTIQAPFLIGNKDRRQFPPRRQTRFQSNFNQRPGLAELV